MTGLANRQFRETHGVLNLSCHAKKIGEKFDIKINIVIFVS